MWILEAKCTANKKGRYNKPAIKSGCGIVHVKLNVEYRCTDCGAAFTLTEFGRIAKQYPIREKTPLPCAVPFKPQRAYLLSGKRDTEHENG